MYARNISGCMSGDLPHLMKETGCRHEILRIICFCFKVKENTLPERRLNKRLKEERCHRIPFHYYFPEELLTRELLEKDGKLSDEMETGE